VRERRASRVLTRFLNDPSARKESHDDQGAVGATIWSEDLGNLLPFYRDVLGLPVGIQIPGFVVLGNLDAPALALGTHSEVRGRNADPSRHMVGFTTDDVRADWKRLKDAGVEFIEDPTEYGKHRIATLKDPEGNLIQLLERTG
jgi:predicted enzyme related to lactoylglutathione lyase